MGSGAARNDRDLADLADVITSVGRKIHTYLEKAGGDFVLSPLEGLVARHIDHHPGISPSVLGRELGLASSNTSAILSALEDRGYITRSKDGADRRSVRLSVTPVLRKNVTELRAAWADMLRPLAPPDADLEAALAVLRALDVGLVSRED